MKKKRDWKALGEELGAMIETPVESARSEVIINDGNIELVPAETNNGKAIYHMWKKWLTSAVLRNCLLGLAMSAEP